jgi:cell division protein ZapA (FtsZ GTPase activity inhibitor)
MIIEVDEYKKKIKGYNPKRSEEFHSESGKLADQDFITHLKTRKYKKVVLMAGGTASGKTEYATSYLKSKTTLVYDGTLKDYKGFNVKLDKIKRYSKNITDIKVVLIVPKNTLDAFSAFIERERKMDNKVFFETHVKSKDTVVKILRETKVKVEIYSSEYNEKTRKLSFLKIKMAKGRKYIAGLLDEIANALEELAKDNGFDIIR